MNRTKINEIFTPTRGVFSAMGYTFGDYITNAQMDIKFFADYGQRWVSPLVDHYTTDGEITDEDLAALAALLVSLHGKAWDRLKKVYEIEYNPIHNYDMVETESVDRGRHDQLTASGTGTDHNSQNIQNTVFGFNSADGVPSDTTDTDTTSSTTTSRTQSTTESEDSKRTLERSGNVGVTTSQQMLESEIELWRWSFIDTVMNDIKNDLTLPIY